MTIVSGTCRSMSAVTVWFSENAIAAWTPPGNGRRGGQQQYSDLAFETALTLRVVFHLPLRQAEVSLHRCCACDGESLAALADSQNRRKSLIIDTGRPHRDTKTTHGPFNHISLEPGAGRVRHRRAQLEDRSSSPLRGAIPSTALSVMCTSPHHKTHAISRAAILAVRLNPLTTGWM